MTAGPRDFKHIVVEHLNACPGASVENGSVKDYMERLRFLSTALAGEAGEFANNIKKEWRGDAAIQPEGDDRYEWVQKIIGEAVDIGNYLSMLTEHLMIERTDFQKMQVAKFLDVEKRPGWALARTRPDHVDDLYAEDVDGDGLGSVPLHPIDTVADRLYRVAMGKGLWTTIRTSASTIQSLTDRGKVDFVREPTERFADDGKYRPMYLDRVLRNWNEP